MFDTITVQGIGSTVCYTDVNQLLNNILDANKFCRLYKWIIFSEFLHMEEETISVFYLNIFQLQVNRSK